MFIKTKARKKIIALIIIIGMVSGKSKAEESDSQYVEKIGRPFAVGAVLPKPRHLRLTRGSLLLADAAEGRAYYKLELPGEFVEAKFAEKLFEERVFRFTNQFEVKDVPGTEEKDSVLNFAIDVDDKFLSSHPHGYRLVINNAGLQCRASDPEGLVNAVSTVNQLMTVRDGQLLLPYVSITDWPEYKERYINNYYKMPKEGLEQALSYLAAYKINGFTLGFHYAGWQGLTDAQRKELKELKSFRDKHGYFYLKMHIHIGGRAGLQPLDISDPEQVGKFEQTVGELVKDYGLNHLMILMDDVKNSFRSEREKEKFKTHGKSQVYLVRHLQNFLRDSGLSLDLSFIPPYYNNLIIKKRVESEGQEYVTQYFRDISELPENVAIVWTGTETSSRRIDAGDIRKYTDWFAKKPALFYYDNNVGFNLPLPNFYGKFDKDFAKYFAGSRIHCNVTPDTLVRKYYAVTFADYAWNPQGFNSTRSWQVASRQLFTPRQEIIPALKKFYKLHGDEYQVFFNKKVDLKKYAKVLKDIEDILPELNFDVNLAEAKKAQGVN